MQSDDGEEDAIAVDGKPAVMMTPIQRQSLLEDLVILLAMNLMANAKPRSLSAKKDLDDLADHVSMLVAQTLNRPDHEQY